MNAPNGGLIGLFLGDSILTGNAPQSLDFNGGLKDSTTIQPLLQQPFYIGSGYTATGDLKSFVVPTGATRVYLGIASASINTATSGSYIAVVNLATPPLKQLSNPVAVRSVSALPLAGQADATNYGGLTAPSYSPPQVNISLTQGRALHIIAAGQILLGSRPSTPSGLDAGGTFGGFGIAGLNAPNGGLIGVFVAPSIVPSNTPPNIDFSGALKDSATISPLLQQAFYIGSGYTGAGDLKSFIVPTGATRLYLGIASLTSSVETSGAYYATVSPDSPKDLSRTNMIKVYYSAAEFRNSTHRGIYLA
jgi:hypothetical protein